MFVRSFVHESVSFRIVHHGMVGWQASGRQAGRWALTLIIFGKIHHGMVSWQAGIRQAGRQVGVNVNHIW